MSGRVREAIEIAREHLEWCSHRNITAAEAMALVGLKDPGPRRINGTSLRVLALAAAWLQLPLRHGENGDLIEAIHVRVAA